MLGLLLTTCTKDNENLNGDLSTYNSDTYVPTPVDDWIWDNITKPYNTEVVYRFNRNLTDVSKDISPIRSEKVQPIMEAVLEGFIKAYARVKGEAFIKTYTPKQFVLYGSASYNTNGSITLGTAEGGRKIVLYELNGIDFDNPDMSLEGGNTVRRRLRTIHHEFTHILNQIVAIPPDFEQISKADYEADWTNNDINPESISRSLGFISRYARSVYTEDFAEVTAHLLVQGQIWYDDYARKSGVEAYRKLKLKEEMIVDYFKQYFDIDFRKLQEEVQKVFREKYGDKTQTFEYWFSKGDYAKSFTHRPGLDYHNTYGVSPDFTAMYQRAVSSLAAIGNAGRVLDSIRFDFIDTENMDMVMSYRNAALSSFYYAAMAYQINIDPNTKEVTFTRLPARGTTTTWTNTNTVGSALQEINDYLTDNVFTADWLPLENVPHEQKGNYAGFYLKDNPDSYFYGRLVF